MWPAPGWTPTYLLSVDRQQIDRSTNGSIDRLVVDLSVDRPQIDRPVNRSIID